MKQTVEYFQRYAHQNIFDVGVLQRKKRLSIKIENVCVRNEKKNGISVRGRRMKRANPKNIYLNERKSTRTLK